MKTVAFFNNKGGVGKTTLIYHLAWMFSHIGIETIAVDLDPQSNLTSMFMDEDGAERLWGTQDDKETILGAIRPMIAGTGDILPPRVLQVQSKLGLIAGHLGLSTFEDTLSLAWNQSMAGAEAEIRKTTAFYRMIKSAVPGENTLVLIDVGPNLGAINRAALLASGNIVVPLAPDLFSLQGLRNLGPSLENWKKTWSNIIKPHAISAEIEHPQAKMKPIGYVIMQHGIREGRPVKSFQRWMDRIPGVYSEYLLHQRQILPVSPFNDPNMLAVLKNYQSLMPMAMEARKPMFLLKPADGAIGAHVEAVRRCHNDFYQLAKRIGEELKLSVS